MEEKKSNVVCGIFDTRGEVENAVDCLKDREFISTDISVLMPSKHSTEVFAHEKATKAPEAAVTGGVSGAVIGGALGWLVGIGSLAIPGVGPLVAAGPIVSTLAGIGVGGALGGVTGTLIGFGIPAVKAKRYENFVKKGSILLSVHIDDSDKCEEAFDLLKSCGAHDLYTTGKRLNESENLQNRPLRQDLQSAATRRNLY